MEYAILVLGRQPRVQRQDFRMAIFAPFQRLVRIADLALTRQENQHIADAFLPLDLIAGSDDAIEHGKGVGVIFLG